MLCIAVGGILPAANRHIAGLDKGYFCGFRLGVPAPPGALGHAPIGRFVNLGVISCHLVQIATILCTIYQTRLKIAC